MVTPNLQYWYVLPIPKEEAYDKIYKWFEEMEGVKFKKKTNRPEYISLTHGKMQRKHLSPSKRDTGRLAGIYKKFIYITLYDDAQQLQDWNCDASTKSVVNLVAKSEGSRGATMVKVTREFHFNSRQSWLEILFQDLFDILGGKPMQIHIGKKAKIISVTADGSFPEDYSLE